MPLPLPSGWLPAMAEVWPLRSEVAFSQALLVVGGPANEALWSEFEEWVRVRAGGMSLDTLRTLTDASWGGAQRARTLREYVEHIAAETLVWAGDGVVLRNRGDPGSALLRWRWLSLSAPPDLLVAALGACNGFDPRTESVTLPDRNLARVFTEKPFAVTHLHVGASVPFGPLWSGLMRRLASDNLGSLRVGDSGPKPFARPEAFRVRLLQSAITRVALASFLWHRSSGAGCATGFGEFLHGPAGLVEVCRRLVWPGGPAEALLLLVGAIHGLIHPFTEEGGHWPSVHRLYRTLLGAVKAHPGSFSGVVATDPLTDWLAPSGNATPEVRFATRALQYLREQPADAAFAAAFWQYQRVRSLTYVHLVEERGTAGLDWFSRHYRRISGMREPYEEVLFQAAFQTEGRGVKLQSLEGRTSPESNWQKVRDVIRGVARNARDIPQLDGAPTPEIGVVLHFVKEHQFVADGRRWSNADPSQPMFRCRFGAWFAKRLQQANAINRALNENPELLYVLRGVDVANVELAVPTWAVAPLIRCTRSASRSAAAACARMWPEWEIEPLRATWHAGEDFTRLASGLRAIHEPIEAGSIGTADRFGHAVALGLRADRWAEAAGEVRQRAEDRLDDLAWEWDRYASGDVEPTAGRVLRIERQIEWLAARIYGAASPDVPTIAYARRLRLQPGLLHAIGYPSASWRDHPVLRHDIHVDGGAAEAWLGDLGGDAKEARGLVLRYLNDPGIYARGTESVQVQAEAAEVDFIIAAQRWLAGRLDALSITVETNPSSNLLIGDFGSLDEHHAFRLEPLHPEDPEALGVSITINSDNPLTFSTSLADEFTYMYTGLRRAGISGGAALGWLDRVRENAWRARFTLPASANPSILEKVIAGPNSSASHSTDAHCANRRGGG